MPVMAHPAKVATPDEAVSGLVEQASAPDEGVSEIMAEEEVTTLPLASSTLTTGWALKATPFVELPGDAVKTSWVAAPALMVKLVEFPMVKPVLAAERVKGPAMPVMAQPANVATPDEVVTGFVVQATVPDPLATDRVIGAKAVVTTALLEFSIATTGCALNATPLLVVPGDVVKISFKVPVIEILAVSPVRPTTGGAEREAAGRAGDLTPGEGGDAAGRGDRVGGAVQRARARSEGQSHRRGRGSDHVAAGVLDLDHRLGAERHAVGRGCWRRGESHLGGGADRQREGARGVARQHARRRAQAVARAGRARQGTPGEGGHACDGVERVGGAGQRAR